jgi:site-specific recombinase XerC
VIGDDSVTAGAFITEHSGTFGRSAMIGLCSSLRVFLRYLRRESVIIGDLARSIELPQVYRLAELPRSIGWDEVRRMLEVVDRRTSVGRRDYAILLLLITYGLRAREVACLTLTELAIGHSRLYGQTATGESISLTR